MKGAISAGALALLSLAVPALSATYGLTDNIVGSAFYDNFQFQAIGDPTHGRVSVIHLFPRGVLS